MLAPASHKNVSLGSLAVCCSIDRATTPSSCSGGVMVLITKTPLSQVDRQRAAPGPRLNENADATARPVRRRSAGHRAKRMPVALLGREHEADARAAADLAGDVDAAAV